MIFLAPSHYTAWGQIELYPSAANWVSVIWWFGDVWMTLAINTYQYAINCRIPMNPTKEEVSEMPATSTGQYEYELLPSMSSIFSWGCQVKDSIVSIGFEFWEIWFLEEYSKVGKGLEHFRFDVGYDPRSPRNGQTPTYPIIHELTFHSASLHWKRKTFDFWVSSSCCWKFLRIAWQLQAFLHRFLLISIKATDRIN